ncbi:ankyrin repeat-containing domain protein [Mycena rosella]|uniref:Ankyrin repeat-containing domain protein n=1 Tax=Mycena rosella TaxID=1033263 RepID=A0AAD7DRX3_MYCRO|nr:ankyrin repeat-containing domain protein [Mycena rosella]
MQQTWAPKARRNTTCGPANAQAPTAKLSGIRTQRSLNLGRAETDLAVSVEHELQKNTELPHSASLEADGDIAGCNTAPYSTSCSSLACMADFIGLVASVLQLVDTVAKLHEYAKGFRDAPKAQQRLLLEIKNLEPLVKELDKRIKDNHAGMTSGMQEFSQPLSELKRMMERLTKKLAPGGISKVSTRIAWPMWGKEDIEDGLSTIERFKSLLSAWLGMDIWDSTQGRHTKWTEEEGYHRGATNTSKLADIAKWVRGLARDQEGYSDDIFNIRQPGTGEWLLNHEKFNTWRSGTGKILWCRGIPGAGKTVLASIVVDFLRADIWEGQNTGVAVIYLNHKETHAHSPSNLLAGVWRQLILGKPIHSDVHRLYAKHREQHTRPSLEEIHAVLCSPPALSGLGLNVNLLLTARPRIGIDHVVATADIETLEIRATEDDVRQHIEAQVLKSSRLSKHIQNFPDLREEIEREIVQHSDGMFLLAKLHIDSLATKHTVKAVREALANMPTDLNSTYDEVLDRIDRQSEEDRNLARRTLSWISHAKRLLHISELREALAVEEGTSTLTPAICWTLTPFYLYERIPPSATALWIAAAFRLEETCRHLIKEVGAGSVLQEASVEGNSVVVRILVENGVDVNTGDGEYDSPLHAAAVHGHQEIISILLAHSADLNFRGHRHLGYGTALQLAAFFGHTQCVRLLIGGGASVDAERGYYGTALYAAAIQGNQETLDLLIENGAPVDVQGGCYGTALCGAAYRSDEMTARTLIEHGADVNAKGSYGPPLCIASAMGSYELVRLLLQHGAEVKATGAPLGEHSPYRATALYAALLQGHSRVANLLIEHGADVNANATAGQYRTVLQAAIARGSESVSRFLIEHGADVNANAGSYGTALHIATRRGHYENVRLLLEYGAAVNAMGGRFPGGSALYLALFKGASHNRIARLLLEHGADANGQAGEYRSVLQLAIATGNEEVARLLMKHGANVNANAGAHGTALYLASRLGSYKLVRVLLEHGAEVNTTFEWRDSTLGQGSWAGHNVGLRGGWHGSPLGAASSAGHTNIVSLLIEHGAASRNSETLTEAVRAVHHRLVLVVRSIPEPAERQTLSRSRDLRPHCILCSRPKRRIPLKTRHLLRGKVDRKLLEAREVRREHIHLWKYGPHDTVEALEINSIRNASCVTFGAEGHGVSVADSGARPSLRDFRAGSGGSDRNISKRDTRKVEERRMRTCLVDPTGRGDCNLLKSKDLEPPARAQKFGERVDSGERACKLQLCHIRKESQARDGHGDVLGERGAPCDGANTRHAGHCLGIHSPMHVWSLHYSAAGRSLLAESITLCTIVDPSSGVRRSMSSQVWKSSGHESSTETKR